jgi:hypothetical protein
VKVVGTVCPKADPQYATLAWVENLKKELNQLAHAPSVQVVGRSHWPIKVLVTCVCQVRELFIIHVGCTLFITFSTDQNKTLGLVLIQAFFFLFCGSAFTCVTTTINTTTLSDII